MRGKKKKRPVVMGSFPLNYSAEAEPLIIMPVAGKNSEKAHRLPRCWIDLRVNFHTLKKGGNGRAAPPSSPSGTGRGALGFSQSRRGEGVGVTVGG